MNNKFVMSILPYQSANTALNNLAEADFENISVIMNETDKARSLADDSGPLRGVDANHLPPALKKYGISDNTVASVQDALQKGSVLIAFVTIPASVDAANEMLRDAGATQTEII